MESKKQNYFHNFTQSKKAKKRKRKIENFFHVIEEKRPKMKKRKIENFFQFSASSFNCD